MQLPRSSATLWLFDPAVDDGLRNSGKALGLFLGVFFGLLLGAVRGMGSGGMLLEEHGWRSCFDVQLEYIIPISIKRVHWTDTDGLRRSARPVLSCGYHRRYRTSPGIQTTLHTAR